ncbi:hypothetical protein [Thiothrix eikelboomii]|uniref:hypothetical protein n=1 Tax=Thiothrix eikelboomii TaxID=92487 RepID=UPI003BAEF1BF
MLNKTTCLLFSSLLIVGQPLQADWCNGRWFGLQLLEMKLSDRVQQAADDLAAMQQTLQEAAARMRLDVEENRSRLLQRVQQDRQRLQDDTTQLCRLGVRAEYPLQYGQLFLQEEDELHAQLRLNLGLYQAQGKVERELQHRVERQQTLADDMLAKYHELSVLSQQVSPLQGFSGTVPDAQRFVQTACLAFKAGDELLETAPAESLEEMLGTVLQQEQQVARENQVARLLVNCSDLPEPVDASGSADKAADWWQNWLGG